MCEIQSDVLVVCFSSFPAVSVLPSPLTPPPGPSPCPLLLPPPFGPSPGPSHLALETEHLTAVACGQTHTLVASGEWLVVATWMDGRRDEWYLGGSGDGG